jgi:hypothetical protein
VPGTVPLWRYKKVYSSSHTDWAAVASPAGIAWATSNGYERVDVVGYIYNSTSGNTTSTYAMGLSAAIPSIPQGWNHSVIMVASYGGFTEATYTWGATIQSFYGSRPLNKRAEQKGDADDDCFVFVFVFGSVLCWRPAGTTRQPSVTLTSVGM